MIRTLALQGYRGFQSFGLSDLKRVNLLVGKNNCGKTSILEAVDLLVSKGNSTVLSESAHRRGEIGPLRGMEQSSSRGREMLPDISHLFFGRQLKQGVTLHISSDHDVGTLLVELLSLPEVEEALGLRGPEGTRQTSFFADDLNPEPVLGLRVTSNVPNWFHISPVLHDGLLLSFRSVRSEISRSEAVSETLPVKFLTADSLQSDSMRIMWDRVLAEGRESEVIHAMKLLESDLDSIHFLTDDAYRGTSGGVLVGSRKSGRRVPLGSFGDGMRRLLALSLSGENRQWVPVIGRDRHRPAFFGNGRDVEACCQYRSGIECTGVCDDTQLRLHPGTRGSRRVQSRSRLGGFGSEDRALPCRSREPGRGAGASGGTTGHRGPIVPASNPRSRLHVEGTDDSHALRHLLIRQGIDYDWKPWPVEFPTIVDLGGRRDLLEGVETAVSVSNSRSIGFVLDANSSIQDAWKAISSRLQRVGVATPDAIPREGNVGEAGKFRARVGVWIMPDNRREGNLEHFLHDLVEETDPLFPYAKESTIHAKVLGARFSDNDADKAVLHTWLAWQEEPGLPYGTAMRARFFRGDSPAAQAFVTWFRKVFNIP